MAGMRADPRLAEIAALVGDPARANILAALTDGRALSASELAYCAGVSPQTTSGHLAKLTEAQLLRVEKQGRHRYYRLATARVGHMIEGIMTVAADAPQRLRPVSRADAEMRLARTCYDHLAGRLGVGLADALAERGYLLLTEDGGEVTEAGLEFLSCFGLDLAEARRRRRIYCRPCLDWTERRAHLAGAVGAALAARCFDLGWFKRQRDTRALKIMPAGRDGLAEIFGLTLPDLEREPPRRAERVAALR
jgi:DNA-binding transcriptional ArsR family regulator